MPEHPRARVRRALRSLPIARVGAYQDNAQRNAHLILSVEFSAAMSPGSTADGLDTLNFAVALGDAGWVVQWNSAHYLN